MTKRLTLTEYRQQNAVWLANEYYEADEISHEIFYTRNYVNYLVQYGAIGQNEKIPRIGNIPTEAEIESYLKSKEVEVEHNDY